MIGALRRVLPLSAPAVSREEASEIAKRECEDRDWPWVEPVRVIERLRYWEVMTRSGNRGANVIIRVDKRDGRVLFAHHVLR
jgi:hypothetical protein